MTQHFKAAFIVLVLAVLSVGAFKFFFEPHLTEAPKDLQALQEMETQGVSDFEFVNLDGQKGSLGQLRGQVVILNFWASWCTPCIEEVPSLIKLVKEFKGDVQLVAISGDSSREDIDVFLKSFPELRAENIHIVWDTDRSLMNRFNVARLPESMVLDKTHKLVKKIVGTINWYTQDSVAYIKSILEK